jgi:uncharacterized protein (DUF1499 family)
MYARIEQPAAGASVWTSRIALFSIALVVTAIVLHRVLGMSTPVAINVFIVAIAAAAVAFLIGAFALVQIWRKGRPGTAAAIFGMVVAAGILLWPVFYLPALTSLPRINDVTTDMQAPPRFAETAKLRGFGANNPTYPGEAFAQLQAAAYPDIKPFMVDRSAAETFDLVAEALQRLKFKIVSEEAPSGGAGRTGWIEAVERTLIIGFYDDVVVRVDGDQVRTRVDVRSASRYGKHDLGRNADRIRRIFTELQARLDVTVPTSSGERISRLRSRFDKAVPKRSKESSAKSKDRRTPGARGPSDAPRGPEPKAKPR